MKRYDKERKDMNKTLQSMICLFSAAIIWGSAFVAQ